MQLDLLFSRGMLTGDGVDDVASFLINGSYDQESGACRWTKTYIGAHDVAYTGAGDGNGIAGNWQLGSMLGLFRIWPGSRDESTGATESQELEEPVEALTVG